MQVHSLIQGTDAWHQFRLEHNGASEIAAVLGLSLTTKRDELMTMKKTGIAKVFSDYVQRNVLDHGHAVEALAQPLAEEIVGEDLYSCTCSDDGESASCDGLSIDDVIAWENKQWNARIAGLVSDGVVPPEHMPQCQQVLMVTKAEKLLFSVTDGTREKFVFVWVLPDPEWFARIRAAWRQFDADLVNFVPAEIVAPIVASAMESLPALTVQMRGELAVISNLPELSIALRSFIGRIPVKASTDQEFADTDSACKALKKFEEASIAEEESAIAKLSNVEEFRRLMADLRNLARTTRLQKEKDVEARKAQIRVEMVQGGQTALAAHIAALNVRLGKPYMPAIAADFGAAIKGKRTVESLRDAINTTLANAKIESNAIADKIQTNLATLVELASAHKFLFADVATLVLKAPDDLRAVATSRIGEHDKAEADRLERQREQIRIEEQAKAEKLARDNLAAEVEAARIAKAREDKIAADAAAAAAKKTADEAAAAVVVAVAAPEAPAPAPAPAPVAAPAARSYIGSLSSASPAPAVTQPAPAANTPPTMKLGDINALIAPLQINAAGLAQLGFEPAAIDKSARLYHHSDFPAIRSALISHLSAIQEPVAA